MSARSGKTIAQWLRDDPIFKAMDDDVLTVAARWPQSCPVAHRHEDTGVTTFVLRLNRDGLDRLRQLLGNVPTSVVHSNGVLHVYRGDPADMARLLRALQ